METETHPWYGQRKGRLSTRSPKLQEDLFSFLSFHIDSFDLLKVLSRSETKWGGEKIKTEKPERVLFQRKETLHMV